MKYQSELIKEIVDTRGHKESSLHYESECVETWIEEAKGAYPKLCDYESEWLKYISILDDTGGEYPEPPKPEQPDPEPPIGEFPYETLIDVTEATVDNVVPLAYKSAILKGQTLVNIADVSTMAAYNGASISGETIILNRSRDASLVQITSANKLLQSGKKYIAILNEINGNTQGVILKVQHPTYVEDVDFVNNKAIFIADTDAYNRWVFIESTFLGSDAGTTSFKWSIIEYREGMENWDIPYFTGMQSVKMPVLTTSNEDGTKTNILTVNEDVTLRGIGDVKDTLDCLTGEVVQNICEIVLDGSEDWKNQIDSKWNNDTHISFTFKINNMAINKWNSRIINCITDKFPTKLLNNNTYILAEEFIGSDGATVGNMNFNIKLLRSRLNGDETPDGFKEWLSQNPITLQYKLANESVKTVDLSIQDQNKKPLSVIKPIEGTMYLSTSSDTIKPLFSGEVPVEAITQNLASFIDLETEE